jgi:hypothetical protein
LDAAVTIGRLPLNTIDELSHAHRTVLNKLTSGVITPTQAQQIDALLESHRRFLETENLAKRLQSLEDLHGSKQAKSPAQNSVSLDTSTSPLIPLK